MFSKITIYHYLQRCVEWSLASVFLWTEGDKTSYVITKAETGDMFWNTRKFIFYFYWIGYLQSASEGNKQIVW